MFKHILIPTDGSDLSRKSVLYGVQLAKECKAKVTALTIAEPYHVASLDAVLVSVGEDEYEAESRSVSDQAGSKGLLHPAPGRSDRLSTHANRLRYSTSTLCCSSSCSESVAERQSTSTR